MDPSGSQLVVIVGQYKSGSTWLENLLSLHPDVRSLRETNVFHNAFERDDLARGAQRVLYESSWGDSGRWGRLRTRVAGVVRPLRRGQASLRWTERPTTAHDLRAGVRRAIANELPSSPTPEHFCRRFFEIVFHALSPPLLLLEKSVSSVFVARQIRAIFPACKLVSIHRDGRDVLVSDRYYLASQHGRQQDFRRSVLRWRRGVEAEEQAAHELGLFTLTYESLLADGEESVQRLLAFLGLARDPRTVDDMRRRSSFEFVTGRRLGTEDPSSFYRMGGSGQWVTRLSDEEKSVFSALAGDWLVRLGYARDADWRSWSMSS